VTILKTKEALSMLAILGLSALSDVHATVFEMKSSQHVGNQI